MIYHKQIQRLSEQGWEVAEIFKNQHDDVDSYIYTHKKFPGVILEEFWDNGQIRRWSGIVNEPIHWVSKYNNKIKEMFDE